MKYKLNHSLQRVIPRLNILIIVQYFIFCQLEKTNTLIVIFSLIVPLFFTLLVFISQFSQSHQMYFLNLFMSLSKFIYVIQSQIISENICAMLIKIKVNILIILLSLFYSFIQQMSSLTFQLLHHQSYLTKMESQSIVIPDDPSVVDPIFQQLKQNFKKGGTRSAACRKQALKRLIEGYSAMKEEFSQSHAKDLGINNFIYQLGTHETTHGEMLDLLKNFQSWMKKQTVPAPLGLGMGASCGILYQPLGVVLVISAWNYPVYTALPPVAAAIAAGNAVILKPSQLAPHTSRALQKLFQTYLDPNYYRVIEGKIQVAKAVSKLPVDMICFTGSTFTGRLVAMEAAKNLTPCLLQLGGKCPIVVDQSAKIESAVLRILMGKYFNCGQTCVGVDHLYVHESIYEQFKQELLRKVDEGYGQHKDSQDGHYGRIVSLARVNRLEQLLKDKHDGKILYGGNVNKDKLYISPTIIEKPKKDSLMMSQQIFGPILPIYSYSNLDDVIRQINDRPKPLVVYMFSENSDNKKKLQNETFSGAYVVNETLMQMTNPHLPFGGVGMSGTGRYHGKSGFIAFSNPKSICETKAGNPYPLNCRFPPYTEKNKNIMLKLIKVAGITNMQIYKGLLLVMFLIIVGLVLGLVVVPKVTN